MEIALLIFIAAVVTIMFCLILTGRSSLASRDDAPVQSRAANRSPDESYKTPRSF